MGNRRQFPDVHWIWKGAISFVYEVHPRIVVKVPQPGEFEKKQFDKELKIYEIFSQYVSLSYRIQNNQLRDLQTSALIKVKNLEPLPLRKVWLNDLAQAVAFLESLNLAHGDLRPDNILIDGDRLKLSDFDCTAQIGTDFEACIPPYGRVLNSSESDHGGAGFLGPRTEQFALGSLYYLINYGFEVYGDRCLTPDNPKQHGPKVVKLLQNMEFPTLDGDPVIDDIIDRCWHNKYATVAELAAHTEMLLDNGTNGERTNAETTSNSGWRMVISRIIDGLWWSLGDWWEFVRPGRSKESTNRTESKDDRHDNPDHDLLPEGFSSKKAFCEDLVKHGLLDLLSSGEPEHLGFSFDWYRHRH
ncbi:conserved hypothetical protein [Coccidioides posadasii str. Silveira]|uniref:Protein kinase domain-containing protein n=2 Tax=Coccidioides posadasii TaxID=199306 RepID=E9DH01_COCPS|nr:conserved hypothetical protein [Coccidioides posadasii str. Silveira]KMM71152.1 hypothetical protein CPAG_07459 [Coccidioides posadasii RMSCC 3488]